MTLGIAGTNTFLVASNDTLVDGEKPTNEAESAVRSKAESSSGASDDSPVPFDKEEILLLAKKGIPLSEDQLQAVADDLGRDVPGYTHGLTWTESEETKIRRILDTRLMPFILFSTFILNMDRTNISNALSDTLLKDVGINLTTVNNAGTVYAVIFSLATFSGAVVAKVIGPQRWIPILMFAWGLVTLAHGLVNDYIGFYSVRAFIALTEGGVIPATLVYLGGFYTSSELSTRLSWFWGVQALASAASGLMASGILQLAGKSGLAGWKWLFIIDGIITVFAAILLYFVFPANATQAKRWFNERDARIAVTRTITADPLILFYNQHVSFADVLSAIQDSRLWLHLIITSIGLTPMTPLATYLPTIIKSFGFNVYLSNALTAPGYVLSFVAMTVMTSHADAVKEHGFHGAFSATWYLLGILLLEFLPDNTSKYGLFAAILFTSSWPFTHPLNIGWMTQNMAPVGKRTVASGAVIAFANIYAVWAAQIYQADDAPRFHRGNYINIAFLLAVIILWIALKYYYIHINRRREAIWSAMTKEQQAEYLLTTTDLGNDRLDFRFAH